MLTTRDIKQLVNTRKSHSVQLKTNYFPFHFTAMILCLRIVQRLSICVHIYLNNVVMLHCAESVMCINNKFNAII